MGSRHMALGLVAAHKSLNLWSTPQDRYLDVAFSEDQLLPVPRLPTGTEFQTECIYRCLVAVGRQDETKRKTCNP